MIDRMSGKAQGHDDFGVYLTPENVGAEIALRKEKTDEIRDYYKKTGTIPLSDFNDSSNIAKDEENLRSK